MEWRSKNYSYGGGGGLGFIVLVIFLSVSFALLPKKGIGHTKAHERYVYCLTPHPMRGKFIARVSVSNTLLVVNDNYTKERLLITRVSTDLLL